MSTNQDKRRPRGRRGGKKTNAKGGATKIAAPQPSPKPTIKVLRKTVKQGKKPPQLTISLKDLPAGSTRAGSVFSVPCRLRIIDRSPTAKMLAAAMAHLAKRGGPGPAAGPLAVVGPTFSADHMSVMDVAAGMGGPAGTGLSDCAALYAKAQANPFGTFSVLPCVPCSPPTPTQRWKTINRGTFVTSSADGTGFFEVCPYVCAQNTPKFSWSSASTYAGGSPAATGVGITNNPNGQLPYSASALGGGVQGRLVALGIRVRNITQALNVGGLLCVAQLGDQQNVNNFTFAALAALPDTSLVPQALSAQGDWTQLSWRPMSMSSLDWQPDDGIGQNGSPTLIVFVKNAPAAATFEFECVEFWEFQGQTTSTNPPFLTVSDADQVGFDRVLDAAQRIPTTPDAADWQKQMAYGLVEAIAHSDSVARTVEDLLGGGRRGGGMLGSVGGILKSILGFLAI